MLHDYQRQRILTLLDPMQDPLGAGYHIIQSTIAIGSGGILGKGWLNGTQAQLDFVPERSTDFILAVFGEEFGLVGNVVLIVLYLLIIGRGLMIAANASTVFARLTAGRHHAHLLHLRLREHGHGERHPAGGGRAAADDQLRRHGAAVDPRGVRDPDVDLDAQAAGVELKAHSRSLRGAMGDPRCCACAAASAPKKRRRRRQPASRQVLLRRRPAGAVPDNLAHVPDAVPRDEPFHRFANRPYTVFGHDLRAGGEQGADARARHRVVVRAQVPRPEDRVGRDLRHVRDDRRAQDAARSRATRA